MKPKTFIKTKEKYHQDIFTKNYIASNLSNKFNLVIF